MKHSELSDGHFAIRLVHGDEIVGSVTEFCENNGIENAAVWGIGSVENPTLAHYRMDKKRYSEKRLEGIFEIASLMGNVAIFEGKPLAHLHTVVSDESMKTFAGHLVKGVCSATVEIVIKKFESGIQKYPDDEVGLKLFDI